MGRDSGQGRRGLINEMENRMRTQRLLRQSLMPTLVLALILVPFFLFNARLEAAVRAFLAGAGDVPVALAAVALLAGDVWLPVPSSLVSLVAAGALGFGLGTATIWVGMTLGCLMGWATGRGILAPLDRAVTTAAVTPSRWGIWAVILCRPIPVLAEMSVMVAAARGVPFNMLMLACAVANLPVALAYGYFGAAVLGEVPLPYLLGAVLTICAAGLAWRGFAARANRSGQ